MLSTFRCFPSTLLNPQRFSSSSLVDVTFLFLWLGGGFECSNSITLLIACSNHSQIPFVAIFLKFYIPISSEMASRVFICRWSMPCHNSSFIRSRMASLKLLLSPTLEGNWIKFLSPDADFYFPILFIYFLDGWGVASIHVFFFSLIQFAVDTWLWCMIHCLFLPFFIAWVYSDFLEFSAWFLFAGFVSPCLSCCEVLVTAIFVAMRMNFCIIMRCRSLVLISIRTSFPCLSCVDKLNLWRFSQSSSEVVEPSVHKHVVCMK